MSIETSGSALASGSIASRFISQNAVDEANAIREKEWKDAYERIGQEPPEKMPEAPSDGRTLFERLREQEELKQEMWDNRMKLSNQYRGLDSEEMAFLSEKIEQKRTIERKNEEDDAREVQGYHEAIAKKNADILAAAEPQIAKDGILAPAAAPAAPKRAPPKPAKKDVKSLMKGVVIKKKPKPAAPAQSSSSTAIKPTSQAKRPIEDEPLIDKKRKL